MCCEYIFAILFLVLQSIGFELIFGMIYIRKQSNTKSIKEAFFMTTLFSYSTYSTEQTIPKWMREERYDYCEQMTHKTQTFKSFFSKMLNLFL